MLVNLNDVLVDAKKNKYAVGLFNTVNLEMARGVILAAERTKSPVIIGSAEVLLPSSASLYELSDMLIPMAKRASVPVVLHYDHGLTEEKVELAMNLGFTSVMYDCSTLDFDGNVKKVSELVGKAHKKGITVEAELGHVGTEELFAREDAYTKPEDAVRFCELTDCDALAIAVGTCHGAYKFTPKLDFKLINTIKGLVKQPLVLHGGSGLSDNDFSSAIENGIAKINIFTDINTACAKAAHDNYSETKGLTDIFLSEVEAVCAATEKKMRLFGCCGRA